MRSKYATSVLCSPSTTRVKLFCAMRPVMSLIGCELWVRVSQETPLNTVDQGTSAYLETTISNRPGFHLPKARWLFRGSMRFKPPWHKKITIASDNAGSVESRRMLTPLGVGLILMMEVLINNYGTFLADVNNCRWIVSAGSWSDLLSISSEAKLPIFWV